MDLFAPLQRSLAEQNHITPTPIQSQTIPYSIEGRDILGCAQTGTGKTAAFALPILDFLGHERPQRDANSPTTLILAPTRELAIQIGESFSAYGKHMDFRMALVYGGVNQRQQVSALKRGVDVLVATPGRLLDLMMQKHLQLGNVQIFVLDEADRMLDMGFLPALRKIIADLPEERQSLFFSATLPKQTVELSSQLLFNPIHVTVATDSPEVDRIDQSIRLVDRNRKFAALRGLLACDSVSSAIVFTRTKRGANQVARKLENAGVVSSAIHGNKSQSARQRALDSFRNKQIAVLVATDVASRGIDVDGVSHVINYDMPVDPESYVHRIGRTARAGSDGVAISFCAPEEHGELRAIERFIGKRIAVGKTLDPQLGTREAFAKSPRKTPKTSAANRQRRHAGQAIAANGKSQKRGQPQTKNKIQHNRSGV
jgi:ATP-dependent RNA helicase RhlE